ncbi:MAG: DUF2344 domain-containing protein, partial [Myxococcales bacterium]|nr:DUF2344 domain-containing protein [Myxococcales bacterium]
RDADVTVSVSSHVPKPHTPFQWCAMDTVDEIRRKQKILKETSRAERVDLKWHEPTSSWVEGIFARGDRRLCDVLEDAWRGGARFDGWDEHLKIAIWQEALAKHRIDTTLYLGTIPVDARLPWDHIDVGLAEGFLAWEYRRALKDRLSHPCGKPYKTLLHHTTIEDALADGRKLVCYDCGVACDLTKMREERLVYLRKLDAHKPDAGGLSPSGEAPEPPRFIAPAIPKERRRCHPKPAFVQGAGTRYRVRYTKLARAAYTSHLDTSRMLQRLLRRAELPVIYSRGFHPHPDLIFGPALGLGIAALAELVDVRLDGDPGEAAVLSRMRAASPEGIRIEQVARLDEHDPGIARVLCAGDYAALLPAGLAIDPTRVPATVERMHKGEVKIIDVARFLVTCRFAEEPEAALLRTQLDWPAGAILLSRVRILGDGSAKASEVIESLLGGPPPSEIRHARLALWAAEDTDLFDLPSLRTLKRPAARTAAESPIDAPLVAEPLPDTEAAAV